MLNQGTRYREYGHPQQSHRHQTLWFVRGELASDRYNILIKLLVNVCVKENPILQRLIFETPAVHQQKQLIPPWPPGGQGDSGGLGDP